MKTFAKLSLLAVVTALIAAPIVVHAAKATDAAGNFRHPTVRRLLLEKRVAVQQLARRLHLTSEQKDAVQQVRTEARDEIRSIRADQNLSAAEKRAKARETIRTARQEARTKLLETQREKLDRLRQRVRERRAT